MGKSTFSYEASEIGERLKKVRKEHGKTQAQIARMLNVSRNTILQLESETNKISVDKLCKYVEEFNVSFDYLIYGREGVSDYELYQKIEELSPKQKEIIDMTISEFIKN